MYACVHTRVHTGIHVCTQACVRTGVCTHGRVSACIGMCVRVHGHVYLCAQVCVCACACMLCSPSQTPRAPQSPTTEAQGGACMARSTQLRSTTQSRRVSWLLPRAPRTSQACGPSSARHAAPCPPDEATGHNSTYTPRT